MTGQSRALLNRDHGSKMLAAITSGAPSFELNAAFHEEVLERVHGTRVPELLHQVLSRRSINVVCDQEATGFLKHDTPPMHEVSVRTLGHEDIARV